ncbi:MAG: DNA polymerase IV [Ornithinimicrobium sp.]
MSRREASIVHVDLDAFFAAVEQRDKPSLRGKAVVVGGTGGRGVVATASYEARRFGARSAMPTHEARRRCPPGTAFLRGRFSAYRASSEVVMAVLQSVTPVIEQVSVDEAFLDLVGAGADNPLLTMSPQAFGASLQQRITEATGGLTASVGLAGTKMMAKIASELAKPAGVSVIDPGTERDVLNPMPVRAISGVGPATARTLRGFGVETVADLARVSLPDLVSIFGNAHGQSLHELARARDDREVTSHRSAKSVSAEETFESDIADPKALAREVDQLARRVTSRLGQSTGFARTITIKARWHDFRTVTRSGSLPFATADPAVISREAGRLLATIDVADGLRLLGVGVSGLTAHAQGELDLAGEGHSWMTSSPAVAFHDVTTDPSIAGAEGYDEDVLGADVGLGGADDTGIDDVGTDVRGAGIGGSRLESSGVEGSDVERAGVERVDVDGHVATRERLAATPQWATGADVIHTEHGPGWVWGSGAGVVTVRFEGPRTQRGPVRSFRADDPQLAASEPPDWREPPVAAC